MIGVAMTPFESWMAVGLIIEGAGLLALAGYVLHRDREDVDG